MKIKAMIRKRRVANRWVVWGMLVSLSLVSSSRLFSAESKSPQVTVSGAVDNPLQLGPSDLQSMPRAKVSARDKDGEATFEGVKLWDIVQRAKPRLGEKPDRAIASSTIVVKGADGYQVVLSLAEISPDFTDKNVVLADRRDGKALAELQGPFQLIVPGDKIHARWVRQVTELEVVIRSLNPKP